MKRVKPKEDDCLMPMSGLKTEGKSLFPPKKELNSAIPLRKKSENLKKVQIGWKHFKEEEDAYVLVPLAKGGGSHQVDLPLSTSKWDLLKTCKSLFFPNGKTLFEKEEEMAFDLANFEGGKIEVVVNIGGKELLFNINNYIEAHKVKNVRIYLRSQKVLDYSSDLLDMHFDNVHVVKENTSSSSPSLIGSTEEREALKLEQDEAFNASLNADKQK